MTLQKVVFMGRLGAVSFSAVHQCIFTQNKFIVYFPITVVNIIYIACGVNSFIIRSSCYFVNA